VATAEFDAVILMVVVVIELRWARGYLNDGGKRHERCGSP
jgi:hypothetical protein